MQTVKPARILALVNKRLPGVTIYDADTLELRATFPTGIAPHEVALSRDGRTAYVPIYGSSGVGKPGTSEHTFHSVDVLAGTELSRLDTGRFQRLHSVVVGRTNLTYVSAEVAAAVVIIDPYANKIVGQIPTGSETSHMIALNREETILYSSNVHAETLSVMDIQTQSLRDSVPTEGPNQRITISPDGQWYVTSLGPAGKVAFYRTSDNELDFAIGLDGRPFTAKFDSTGRWLYNVGTKDGETCAWKISVENRAVHQTRCGLGGDPGSLEVNPFTGQVFISDQPSRQLHILCPDTWDVLKRIHTEPAPDAMAFAALT